jgi:transposase-like protein
MVAANDPAETRLVDPSLGGNLRLALSGLDDRDLQGNIDGHGSLLFCNDTCTRKNCQQILAIKTSKPQRVQYQHDPVLACNVMAKKRTVDPKTRARLHAAIQNLLKMGVTQRAIAEEMDVSPSWLSRWLDGKTGRTIDVDEMDRFEAYLAEFRALLQEPERSAAGPPKGTHPPDAAGSRFPDTGTHGSKPAKGPGHR